MKIIIFGCGKIGATIISALSGEGHDIVAVDRNPQVVEETTTTYDVMGLCGNGVDSDTLIEAGAEEAELFVAVTNSDELNMLGCFLARKMGTKHTIARIRNPEYNDNSLTFLKQTLDLSMSLNPELIAAHDMYNILRFPAAVKVDTFSGRNLEIVELLLKQDSPFVSLSLSELRKKHPEKFLVCYVMRDEEVFIPSGHFVLQGGDRIGVTAAHAEIAKLMKNIGMPQKQPKNVIILGAGKSAYYLAKMLSTQGIKVKIIDKSKDVCEKFASELPDVIMINGDGLKPEILAEEGIDDTEAFISLTGSDEVNMIGSFFAKSRNVPTVITKIKRHDLALTAEKLGLECIVSPQAAVSEVLSRYARGLQNSLGSNVETLYKVMDGKAEILEFKVNEDFEYSNISLREMALKENILVAGIIRHKKPLLPSGNDVILPGDKVVVIAAGHKLGDLSDIIEK